MTNVIELAKQAGVPHVNACRHSLERFATLVRNAALEEAAQAAKLAASPDQGLYGDGFNDAVQMIERSIRNLKEPTP